MAETVVLMPNGSRFIGFYDSYGRVNDSLNLADQRGDFSVYHKACWELSGRPEFTKQSPHSRDQGFCHAMHGKPFPPPTKEWMELAKSWQYVDRLITGYWRMRAELDCMEAEKTWATLTPERQLALCSAYERDKTDRRARNRERELAYYNDPDENAVEPKKEEDPENYRFDGLVFDYGWLGVLVTRAAYDR